jgi:environmental stress-induced protein Ves
VLRGNGVVLHNNHSIVQLRPFETAEYDGAADWIAKLVAGPVTALNVMCSKERYRMRVRAIAEPLVVRPNCEAIVLALRGMCGWSESDTTQHGLVNSGEYLVASDLIHPLRLVPVVPAMQTDDVVPPVLVTIESSSAHTNDCI